MIFVDGYPKITGASDLEDSSHLAGILAIFEHPAAVDCRRYITGASGDVFYIRCPNSKNDLSRDQAWLLMTGLLKQGYGFLVKRKYIRGKDMIYHSLKGLETIANRGRPYFWQKWWAIIEVWIHATWQPLEEPFQTIAACEAYGLYEFWTSRNKLWRWSIRRYLSQLDGEWRQEKELAEWVIKEIERRVS